MSTSLEVASFNNNPNDSGTFNGLSRFSRDRAHPLFVLTPHTAVKVTGQYRVEASVVNVDYASLEASARLWTWGADPGSTSVSMRAFNWDSPDTLHDGASGSFSATWSNTLGLPRNVWGGITLEANSVTLAVPEPGTYALMAAGLGLICMAVRRRRTGA